MLQLAIGEYEKLAQLKPNDVETHLLLGQLYGLNHDSAKAEAQFKLAQGIDANSEEVALNMARLYSEQGDPKRAAEVLNAIPVDDRSPRIEFALGASYEGHWETYIQGSLRSEKFWHDIAGLNLDMVFLSVDGISPDAGLTTHHEIEAGTDRALIERASRVTVVADSSKIGKVAFARICQLGEGTGKRGLRHISPAGIRSNGQPRATHTASA